MVARPGVASGSSTVAVAAARRGPPRRRRSSLPNSRASPQVASPVRFPSTFPPPSMAIQQVESAEQFRELTAAAALSVACFSAPWCGGCKLVDPQVEALARELSSLQFVKVNAEGMEALCEELEVASFPTFRVYKAGSSLGECISSKFDKVEEFIRAHAKRGDPPAEEADQLMPEAANEATPVVETDASISGAVTPLMGSEASDGENEEDDESPGKKRSERDEEEQDVEEPSPKKAKTEDEIVDEANAAALVVDSATDETSETMDTTEVASTSIGEISAEVEMTTNDGVGEPNMSEGEEEEGGGETAAANKIDGDVVEPAAADDEGATNEMMEDDIIETDETASVEDVVADENEAVLVMDEGLIATQIPPAELLESVELSKITDEQTRTDASSKANDCATADKLPADNHDANESALDEVSVENAADATLSSDELLAQKLEQTESGTSVPLANGADPASADNAVAA